MIRVPLLGDGGAGARARARQGPRLAGRAGDDGAVSSGGRAGASRVAARGGDSLRPSDSTSSSTRPPGALPTFTIPATDWAPTNWDRLIVSRWDSGNYIELGLRGYQYCPPRGPTLPVHAPGCNLAFYPTYGLAGRYVGMVTGLPIDFAMWAISLVSSFLFLFLWTGKDLTSRLGLAETYLALLFFNAYTTGYCLVMVQTEPLTLVLAMGAFVAFARRHRLLGALLAGAATGVRITGVGDRARLRRGAAGRALARAPAIGLALGARRRCWRSSASGASWR